MTRVAIVVLMVVLYFVFFKRIAGTLLPTKLNLNNLIFWWLLFFAFIGSSAVFLGFREHYLIKKCSEGTFDIAYVYIMWALIGLPLVIAFFQRVVMKIDNYNEFYGNYILQEIDVNRKDDVSFFVSLGLALIGIVAMVYTFYYLNGVPLFQYIMGNSEIVNERIAITNGFEGNVYIRNLFMLILVPALSYFAYVNMRVTKQKKWIVLFVVLFIASILCKTYNFEKAPIITYLFYFYLIEVLLGNIKNIFKVGLLVAILGAIVLGMYFFVFGYSGKILTLSSGPVSRICMSQIATGYLHVEMFPYLHSFLNGAGLPQVLIDILGLDVSESLRSARLVMMQFNPTAVENGTAGVMNSLYFAEAYANFGKLGVIIAPIIAGFDIAVIPNFFLKQKKSAVTIVLYVLFTSYFINMLVGGFFDFIYNATLIFIFVLFLAVDFFIKRGKIKIKLSDRKGK